MALRFAANSRPCYAKVSSDHDPCPSATTPAPLASAGSDGTVFHDAGSCLSASPLASRPPSAPTPLSAQQASEFQYELHPDTGQRHYISCTNGAGEMYPPGARYSSGGQVAITEPSAKRLKRCSSAASVDTVLNASATEAIERQRLWSCSPPAHSPAPIHYPHHGLPHGIAGTHVAQPHFSRPPRPQSTRFRTAGPPACSRAAAEAAAAAGAAAAAAFLAGQDSLRWPGPQTVARSPAPHSHQPSPPADTLAVQRCSSSQTYLSQDNNALTPAYSTDTWAEQRAPAAPQLHGIPAASLPPPHHPSPSRHVPTHPQCAPRSAVPSHMPSAACAPQVPRSASQHYHAQPSSAPQAWHERPQMPPPALREHVQQYPVHAAAACVPKQAPGPVYAHVHESEDDWSLEDELLLQELL